MKNFLIEKKKILIIYLVFMPIMLFFARRLFFGAEENLLVEIMGAFLVGTLSCWCVWGLHKKSKEKK